MKRSTILLSFVIAALAIVPSPAGDESWRPLFNGKDLTGWVNVNCAPNTFTVRDGMIVSTGIPTGVMRTREAVRELHPRAGVEAHEAGRQRRPVRLERPDDRAGHAVRAAIEVQILDGTRQRETRTPATATSSPSTARP